MSEWPLVALSEIVEQVDERRGVQDVSLVLSVTEKRGIIPQEDVFKKRIATENTSKYKVLQPLDIAYNPYLLWTGAIGQWDGDQPGVTSPVYETFRVRRGHDPRFAGLILTSGQLTAYFDATAIGSISRRRRTPVPVFLAAKTAAPPLAEQQRIVAVMASVDAQIEALTGEVRKATMVRRSFEADTCASFESKPTLALGDIAEVVGGVTKDKNKEAAEGNVEAPYLRVANVQRGFLDLADVTTIRVPPRTLADRSLRRGDLLLNEGGDRDKLGRGWVWEDQIPNCVHQNHVHRARIHDQAAFLPKFVSMWANTFGPDWFFDNGGQTSGIASISVGKVRQFPIPAVPAEDQQRIVRIGDALRSVEFNLTAELTALRTVRADLLSALLAQEITVDKAVDRFVETSMEGVA